MSYFSQTEFDDWVSQTTHTDASLSMISPQQLDASFTDVSFIFHTDASHGLFTSLSAEQLEKLSTTNVTALFVITTDNSYNTTDYVYDVSHDYITGDQMALFSLAQMQAIPQKAIARLFKDPCLKVQQIQFLDNTPTKSQLVLVSKESIAARFSDLTDVQIQDLSGTQLTKLSPTHVAEKWSVFTPAQIPFFSSIPTDRSDQLTYLTPDIMMNAVGRAIVNTQAMTTSQVQSLSAYQISGWDQQRYSDHKNNFTAVQIEGIVNNSGSGYNYNHFIDNYSTLIPQLYPLSNHPTDSQLTSLTSMDVSAICQYLSPTQVKSLNYGQTDASGYQVSQIDKINGLLLTDTSINSYFTAPQIAHMFDVSGLLTTLIDGQVIHDISTNLLTSLLSTQIANNLTIDSSQNLTSYFSNSQFASLKADTSFNIVHPGDSSWNQLEAFDASQIAGWGSSLNSGTTEGTDTTILTHDGSYIYQALNHRQRRHLRPDQLTKLNSSQVRSWFSDSSGDYITTSFTTTTGSNFTPAQVRSLSTEQLLELSSTHVAACVDSSGHLYFTQAQIQSFNMTTANIPSLITGQTINQPPQYTASLFSADTANITNVTELDASQVAILITQSRLSQANIQALSDGVYGSMYNQLSELTDTDLSNCTTNDLFNYTISGEIVSTSAIFYAFLPQQIPQLTYGLNGASDGSGNQLASLTPAMVANRWNDFSPGQLASLKAPQMISITPTNVQNISSPQVFSVFNTLTRTQISGLTPHIGSPITTNQFALLRPDQIAAKIEFFDSSQVQILNNDPACGENQLANLTGYQIANQIMVGSTPSAELFSYLSSSQIKNLLPNQLSGLSATQVHDHDRWPYFIGDQISTFTPASIYVVSSVALLDGSSNGQLYLLDPSQVMQGMPYFTPEQYAMFTTYQLTNWQQQLDNAAAAAAAIALANQELIHTARLAATAMLGVSAEEVQTSQYFTTLILQNISAGALSNLSQAQVANLSSDQISVLTGDQIVAISQYLTQPQVAGYDGGANTALKNGTSINNPLQPVFAISNVVPFNVGGTPYNGITIDQIKSILHTAPTGVLNLDTNIMPLYPNYSSVSHLAASFISYLTADAFGAFSQGALATFTQEQAMYVSSAQYSSLTIDSTTGSQHINTQDLAEGQQRQQIIHHVLMNDSTPITFDLVGFNTDAWTPLLLTDKMYEPKLGTYDAEVIIHMSLSDAQSFITYKYSNVTDPWDPATNTTGISGQVHLYLDKESFMTAVVRGASNTDLSIGVSIPDKFSKYTFGNGITAYSIDPSAPSDNYNLNWIGNVIKGSMSSDNQVSMSVDMIQYIADQTFNSWMAYDLFNEQEKQNTLLEQNINRAINNTIRPILDSYDKATPGWTDEDEPTMNTLRVVKTIDLSNNYYTLLDISIDASGLDQTAKSNETSNIPSCIYDIMFQNQPQRFKTALNNRTTIALSNPNTTNRWDNQILKMPFIAGDTLRFICTCNTHTDQHTLGLNDPVVLTDINVTTPPDQAQIKPRKYLISMVLGDVVDCGCD